MLNEAKYHSHVRVRVRFRSGSCPVRFVFGLVSGKRLVRGLGGSCLGLCRVRIWCALGSCLVRIYFQSVSCLVYIQSSLRLFLRINAIILLSIHNISHIIKDFVMRS